MLGAGVWNGSANHDPQITYVFPAPAARLAGLPVKPDAFLNQAVESIHAPSGAIMLCASSVDAMLKDKGYKAGGLYERIEKAATANLITKEMSLWAHDIRLDANDERHADDSAPLPNESDAQKCIEFTKALAMFLYVLPAMVEGGRTSAGSGRTQ